MILETGNMWQMWGKTDLFCITTNSTVTKDGRLVMGRGIAQEARDTIRGLDERLGRMVGYSYRPYSLLILNDLVRERTLQEKFGAFQVKYSFSQPAETNIIAASAACLFLHICKNPNIRVDLNFPGVGYGNLPVCEVWPIVSKLPDNVHVWCDEKTYKELVMEEVLEGRGSWEQLVELDLTSTIRLAPEVVTISESEIQEAIRKEEAKGIRYKTNNKTGVSVTSAVAKTDDNFGMERGVKKS